MVATVLGVNLRHIKHPSAINRLTSQQTIDIVREQSHPLHIRIKRKLDAFDSTVLHWRVQAPLSLSKKRVVRDRAVNRLKQAIVERLLNANLDAKGQPLGNKSIGHAASPAQPLFGVAVIHLQDLTRFSIGPWSDVQQTAQAIYKRLYDWIHVERSAKGQKGVFPLAKIRPNRSSNLKHQDALSRSRSHPKDTSKGQGPLPTDIKNAASEAP